MERVVHLGGHPQALVGQFDDDPAAVVGAAAAAEEAGLAQIVVSGTQWEGYLVGLLVEIFGLGWFEGGSVDIKIPRSVRIGDVIRAAARLESLSECDGKATAELAVWCENASGEHVLVGAARCAMPGTVTRPA